MKMKTTGCVDRRGFIAGLAALAILQQGSAPSARSVKRWYKGNIHAHTLVSDGQAFPLEAALLYRDAGYDFLMFSDHNLVHDSEQWITEKTHLRKRFKEANARRFVARYPQYAPATRQTPNGDTAWRLAPFDEVAASVSESGRFLLMSGCEYNDDMPNASLHCNVVNTYRNVHPRRIVKDLDAAFDDLYADYRKISDESDSFFMVNHPIWWFYDIDPRTMAKDGWDRARFFEVSNNPGPDGVIRRSVWANRELMAELYDEDKIWDYVLASRLSRKGPILYGTGTDDTHDYANFYRFFATGQEFFRSWICVRSEALTPAALVAAMKRGDFYAANGTVPVTLKDIRFENGTFHIEIDPKPGVEYTIRFYGTKRGVDLTCPGETTFDLQQLADRLTGGKLKIPRYAGKSRCVPILPKGVGEVLSEITGTRAAYSLKDDDLYVRAKVITSNGVAWTQPYALGRRF